MISISPQSQSNSALKWQPSLPTAHLGTSAVQTTAPLCRMTAPLCQMTASLCQSQATGAHQRRGIFLFISCLSVFV